MQFVKWTVTDESESGGQESGDFRKEIKSRHSAGDFD